jgi:energy-coupling factor transporter ATP-binding protein EcfA2
MIWIKDRDVMSFSDPLTFLILGTRGSGKSTLIETMAEYHLQRGQKILDLFGSRDGEGLGWLRSEWVKDRRVLLIHGNNTDIESSWNSKPIGKVSLNDIEDNDMLISASTLYSDPDTEFLGVAGLTDLMYKRTSWRTIVFCLVREASNLYYSRLKVTRNQQLAKSQEIYLLREARHMGISMGMDTLKFTSVDLDVRSVCDFLFFKSLGLLGLPRDLEWLYGYVEPSTMRRMDKSNFVVVSKSSAAGLGSFSPLPWHKKEREDMMKILDITAEHGTPQREAKYIGHGQQDVSDSEHLAMVEASMSGSSFGKIHREGGRSLSTVSRQLNDHDEDVRRVGACIRCTRMKAAAATKILLGMAAKAQNHS